MINAGYDLVDRNKIAGLLKDQDFQMNGAVDTNKLIAIGRQLGPDALVFGSVTVYTPEQSSVVMVDLNYDTTEPVMGTKTVTIEKDGRPTTQESRQWSITKFFTIMKNKAADLSDPGQAGGGGPYGRIPRTGEIAWVGSDTEDGVNVQDASDLLAKADCQCA